MSNLQNPAPDFGSLFMRYVGDAISHAVEDGILRAMEQYQPKQVAKEPPRNYTRKEATEVARCSYPTLHSLMNKGLVKFIKVGRKTLFPADEFDRLIASGELRKYRRTH